MCDMGDNQKNDSPLVNRASVVVNNPQTEENQNTGQIRNNNDEDPNSIPILMRQLMTELGRLNSRIQALEELMMNCNSVIVTVLQTLTQLAMLNNNDLPNNEP